MNHLLVVPPTGFVINVSYRPGSHPIDLASFGVAHEDWGTEGTDSLGEFFTVDADSALWQVPSDAPFFAPGSHTLWAVVSDVAGNVGFSLISFAVRDFPGSPPIGTGQKIWLDFDYDATRDFSIDLQAFGLGSPGAPALSAIVEEEVIAALLDRVEVAYHDQDPNNLGEPDPVAVDFFSEDPGGGDVTHVCVGGEDPSGGSTIGSILIDPNNSRRSSVECASIPPTGVFPSELLVLASDATFQETFDPLRSGCGGIPVGEHPLDPIVLDELFDPGSATPEELERYDQIYTAVDRFGAVLGSIVAHEVGHALGLVPPSAPGIGLYGGASGARYVHSVTPSGTDPPENELMKAGYTFTFSKLGGLNGQPLPFFRPLNFAYLRDRALAYTKVTELLPPPVVTSVEPAVIDQSATQITVTGDRFAGTPAIRCVNQSYSYNALGEAFVSQQQVTAWVIQSQIPAGVYDLELTNADGQSAVLPNAIVVP